MNILFLGDSNSPLFSYLESIGENVVVTSEKINEDFLALCHPEFIISYGYRHIISEDILVRYPDNAINLHVSFLPWNRGADPNFWSFVEDTPKGVTIHYLDKGIDTGDIIAQKIVEFSDSDTLHTSYLKLHHEIQMLFKENWKIIRSKQCHQVKQPLLVPESFHKSRDKEKLIFLLTRGWDTPITILKEYAAETQLSKQFWCNS